MYNKLIMVLPLKSKLSINISEFKAKALRLIEETAQKGKCYIITKKGIPVAQVIPIEASGVRKSSYGSLKDFIEIKGDIVHFDSSNEWDVLR